MLRISPGLVKSIQSKPPEEIAKRVAPSVDRSVWLSYWAGEKRLYVEGPARASIAIEALSGGGQTSAAQRENRKQSTQEYGNAVPTSGDSFDPLQRASGEVAVSRAVYDKETKTWVPKELKVPSRRGGVIPPGEWLAVKKGAAGWREPNRALGQKSFPTWWLYPHNVSEVFLKARDRYTFYIHIAGFLGSDGCIVMVEKSLGLLDKQLKDRPYTFLRVDTPINAGVLKGMPNAL